MTTATTSPKSVKSSPRKSLSPSKTPKTPPPPPSSEENSKPLDFSRPSAEDLVDLERELQRLISRKIQADTNLVKVETRLYDLETDYLNETQSFGNLIHGLEGYLGLAPPATSTTTANGSAGTRRSALGNVATSASSAPSVNPQQRLFSSTSTTFTKSLALSGRMDEAIANGYTVPNSSEGGASDLTSINGLRGRTLETSKSRNRPSSSPTKKNSSNKSVTNGTSGVNKTKKASDTADWKPPSMKSSRKK